MSNYSGKRPRHRLGPQPTRATREAVRVVHLDAAQA